MTESAPAFSVIIPTRDRPDQLVRCLRAIRQLDFPREAFEVIVVDDGSKATPAKTLEQFQQEINLVVVTQSPAGPATARNAGARRARGAFLSFTDDDCAPAHDWLGTLAARLNASPQSAVGGQTINALNDNIFSTASQLLIQYLYTYYNRDPKRARFFASNNFALSREHFLSAGGFDESFPVAAAEDRDYCDRWLFKGNTLVYEPRAIVYHAHVLTLKEFFRQHWRYGHGAVYFHRAHAARGQGRVRFEPPGFYSGLVLFPFSKHARHATALCFLLILTQIATILGFISGILNRPRRKNSKSSNTR